MKCPYRTHRIEYPDNLNDRTIHSSEEFEDCYESECAYWVYAKPDDDAGYCGKAKADMSEDKKDD